MLQDNQVTNVALKQLDPKRIVKMASYHAVKTQPLVYALHKLVMEKHLHGVLKRTAQLRNEINAINTLLKRHKVSFFVSAINSCQSQFACFA